MSSCVVFVECLYTAEDRYRGRPLIVSVLHRDRWYKGGFKATADMSRAANTARKPVMGEKVDCVSNTVIGDSCGLNFPIFFLLLKKS